MSLLYLYCLLPGEVDVDVGGLQGMEDGTPLQLVPAAGLLAVASEVGDEFAEANLNARIGDLDWLSPRAVRHHEVVDQVYARCKPLLPLTFGAIFESRESLVRHLAEQRQELAARLEKLRGREQWDLKLSREQATFVAQLRGHSGALAELDREIAAKPPGTRFLLEKKRQNVETREAQRVSAAIRSEVHDALRAVAVEAQRDELPRTPPSEAVRLELRSAYLVDEPAAGKLHAEVQALSGKYAPLGYSFELTGPWPPFTFAGGLS